MDLFVTLLQAAVVGLGVMALFVCGIRAGVRIYAYFRWSELRRALVLVQNGKISLRSAKEERWLAPLGLMVQYYLAPGRPWEEYIAVNVCSKNGRLSRRLIYSSFDSKLCYLDILPLGEGQGSFPLPPSARGYLSRILKAAQERSMKEGPLVGP